MTAECRFEYFFLEYAPDALCDHGIKFGLVLLDPSSETGFCAARLADDWVTRVRSVDPDADLETLLATWREFEKRLGNPEQRKDLLEMMEDSFSSSIRVSSRQECYSEDAVSEIKCLAARHLRA